MLILVLVLVLVLVLKDSLRTFFKSLSLSWSLGSGPCPCPGHWGSGPCPCSGPCGSGPCPYPGPCGLVLVLDNSLSLFLVLARTCFHYSIIPIYSHIIVVAMHTISFSLLIYVFPAVILLCVYKYDVYDLAMFFCYNHRHYKAYNIYGYNTSFVFHLESSNENLK